MTEQAPDSVERMLREELAQGDLALASARPVLRHLLGTDDHALFSDEVIARVRGMIFDIARQLLEAHAETAEVAHRPAFVAEHQERLARPLFDDPAFLSHAHALAIEGQLLERLRCRSGIDPVLTPLIQELAASGNAAVASLAMAALAAQARFVQYQRRMELPLRDLPGELLHKALLVLRTHSEHDEQGAAAAEGRLRAQFEEGAGRLGLLARIATSLESRASRALAIDHAGLSVFASALAVASGQERDVAVLALSGRQYARLAISLRAAGLSQEAVEAQFAFLHPDLALPEGFELLRTDVASALLAGSLSEVAL